jgi:hypothetical protein
MPKKRLKKLREGGPLYAEFRIHSWDKFLDIVTDASYMNWAFRGQRDDSPLHCSLARYFRSFGIDPRAWPDQEERILRIFKRKAHQYLPQPPAPNDDFQWLALMQHHGAPTRLLDFTWSPYVAAFFALERATANAAVWALNPKRVEMSEPRKPGKIDPRLPGNFEKYFLKGNTPVIWLGEPDTMNKRLIAQSGTFALPGILDRPLEEILGEDQNPGEVMAKFILSADRIRETAMRELYRMNITWATLFPDLDGLARSMGYELEFHWAYNPRTMQPLDHE